MLKFLRSYKVVTIVSFFLALFDVLFFFSMRILWSGLGKALGEAKEVQVLPIIFFILMIVGFIGIIVQMIFRKEGFYRFINLGLSGFWVIAFIIIFALGGADYLQFVMRNFLQVLLITICVFFLAWLIFFFPKTKIYRFKVAKISFFLVPTLIALVAISGFRVNYFDFKPVVYAVEDNYQIVFTLSSQSDVYVEVGGVKYFDTFAGSSDSEKRVHKVEIPMSILDTAKEYTVGYRSMFYRGAFGGWFSSYRTYTSKFIPVDLSDGLSYFSLSDVHGAIKPAASAASYFKDKLDFVVLAGDIVSLVDNDVDANQASRLVYEITKGQRPAVYARGNHEVKEEEASNLYRYVGSKNQKFYYWFRLGDVFGTVLDLGEDHEDDWWEYYGTAHFQDYRNEQKEWLKNLDPSLYSGAQYMMNVSHIPVVHINSRGNFLEDKKELTTTLNALDIDMAICGHQHDLVSFIPGEIAPFTKLSKKDGFKGNYSGGQLTDFNFPSMMVGKRSDSIYKDAQTLIRTLYTGTAISVDFVNNTQTCEFINNRGEVVEFESPYVDTGIKTKEVFSLKAH